MGHLFSVVFHWFNTDRILVLLAIAGLGSYYVAYAQMRETKQARKESLEPLVVAEIVGAENDRDVMVLVIKNVGPSIARNVRIEVSPPPTRSFDTPDATPMHQWRVFTHGIATMPPSHQLVFLWDIGSRRFNIEPALPSRFTFTITAVGPFGPTPPLTYDIDLEPMRDAWVGQTSLRTVVDALKEISASVQPSSAGEQVPKGLMAMWTAKD
jgi:hypothetical protein